MWLSIIDWYHAFQLLLMNATPQCPYGIWPLNLIPIRCPFSQAILGSPAQIVPLLYAVLKPGSYSHQSPDFIYYNACLLVCEPPSSVRSWGGGEQGLSLLQYDNVSIWQWLPRFRCSAQKATEGFYCSSPKFQILKDFSPLSTIYLLNQPVWASRGISEWFSFFLFFNIENCLKTCQAILFQGNNSALSSPGFPMYTISLHSTDKEIQV